MIPVRTEFSERTAERRTEKVPLSHLSVELGHFYMEDFKGGREYLRDHFERVQPWAHVAEQRMPGNSQGSKPRVSFCFMVDDYFTRESAPAPAAVLPDLIEAAAAAKIPLDYIGRESAWASSDTTELVLGRLVPDPRPDTNGFRPPVKESGWLCNGQRSPETGEAMHGDRWQPPVESGARNHSVFLDVELRGQGKWSCSYLASVWQLLRLGVLRDNGRPVVTPQSWPEGTDFPDSWDEMPAVIKINPQAHPFAAYRTMSIHDSEFLSIEAAVRTILSEVDIDKEVQRQLKERAAADCKEPLPEEVKERLAYVFLTRSAAG